MSETHSVEVAGIKRELPLVEVAPGVTIALLNILGDIKFVRACAEELAKKLERIEYDVLVTAEAKSIPLIHVLASLVKKDYLVLRKSYKGYMGEAISAETISITTRQPQRLYLDEKDLALIKGKRVVLLDDVISTGSTQKGMRAVMDLAGAEIAAEAAIFTEGDPEQWGHILSLGHLPLFLDD
jgi:adenine phosphoribosyltransferase